MSALFNPANRAAALEAAIRERVVVADGATGSLLDLLLGDASADRRDLVALEMPEIAAGVHRAYLAAGAEILKTATFNASARGLVRFTGGNLDAAKDLARRLNGTSAALARAAADESEKADGRPRWVAGSVGPGSDAPSLGGCSYRELRASYLPQFLGLIAGGADLALIETVQDTLQCKAAIGALEEAGRIAGRRLPFIASATVDARGRMLSGASPAAFAAIVEPFFPLAIGLNCSGGPDELEPAFEALAGVSSAPICIMPNAGLPRSLGGKVSWPLDAEGFALKTGSIAKRLGAGIAGGCCGTGPDHIAALARTMAGAAAPAPRPARIFALASAFEAVSRAMAATTATVEANEAASFLVIDERSNASGSAAFKALVKSGDLDAAARFAADRAARGPAAVDISVAGSAKDEAATLAGIVSRVASVAGAALSIDTTDPAVLEAVLPLVGGRPLVNSVNLEDEAKAGQTFGLAREFGAAVVCLAMDETGPARTSETKLAICRRLYALALAHGLAPQDLLFDTCTFPVASGDKSLAFSAAQTIAAVGGLPEACPGSGSVLGVGNCSFGLPKALRPGFTSRFTAAAGAAGLGAAIVDPAALARPVPEGFSEAADALIDARAGADGYGAAVERLLAFAPAAAESAVAAESASALSAAGASRSREPGSLEALSAAIIAGDAAGAAATVSLMTGAAAPDSPATSTSPAASISSTDIAAAIAGAMAELGRRYDAGAIALPLVLRSADAARDAFGVLRAAPGRSHPAGSRVVLSTVRGDLHDIGKNLVGMVLESAGFDVVDLGTDRNADDIARAAADSGALAVGVSGLLTRSLVEMEKVAGALAATGSSAILLCGGAAVDREYVADRIEPVRPGLVAYARDPFEAVGILERRTHAQARAPGSLNGPPHGAAQPGAGPGAGRETDPAVCPACAAGATASTGSGKKRALVEGPAFIPSFLGSAAMDGIGFEKLVAALDVNAVVRSRWGYADKAEGQAALAGTVASLRLAGGVEAACRYGYFRTTKPDGETVVLHDGAAHNGAAGAIPFRFPREPAGERRSVADFYADDDMAAAFCVTLGRRASDYLASLKAARDSSAYLRAHGLLAGLAEAAAELTHDRISLELTGRGAAGTGKRYSFGFPGCPGVEANAPLLDLLGGARIGLRTTEGHQLDPEFSVTAIVIQRAQARYLRA